MQERELWEVQELQRYEDVWWEDSGGLVRTGSVEDWRRREDVPEPSFQELLFRHGGTLITVLCRKLVIILSLGLEYKFLCLYIEVLT